MTHCLYFGALMIGAILAHHGSPWLAFALGCVVLVGSQCVACAARWGGL